MPPSPPMALVTPIRTLFSARPFRGSTPPDWSIMSIQPGVTYLPAASMTRVPVSAIRPIRAIRPLRIPTSARIHGFPMPSSRYVLLWVRLPLMTAVVVSNPEVPA